MNRKLTAALCALLMCASAGCADTSSSSGAVDSSAASAAENSQTNDNSSENGSSESEPESKSDPKSYDVSFDENGADAVFGTESGFYDSEFDLTLTASDGTSKIYYTTDGSDPTPASNEYTAPIHIADRTDEPNVLASQTGVSAGGDYIPFYNVAKGTVIKAAAFSDDNTRGAVTTHTFFVGIDRQSEYLDVPVISIVTDTENLFDYETGIYTLGKHHDEWLEEDSHNKYLDGWQHEANYSMRGSEWERPVSVELIESSGAVGFSQDMGMRIMGAASRNEMQKSLRLTARSNYGVKNVKYELIPGNTRSDGSGAVDKYKSFVLRNGGNDCNFAKIRDPLLQDMVIDRDFETLQSTPCVAFINGEYWGMYTLTEDYNDNYFQNNYEIEKENVILIKRGELEEGTDDDILLYEEMRDFISDNDMTDPDNYKKAGELLDLRSFAEYCAFNIYVANQDSIFDNNNWRMWRVREPVEGVSVGDGKWRMVLYDTDYSTGIYDGGTSFKDNSLSKVLSGKKMDEGHPGLMLVSLSKNREFMQMFVNCLCDMRNVSFEAGKVDDAIEEMSETYVKLAKETYNRFGPQYAQGNSIRNKIGELKSYLDNRYALFAYTLPKSLDVGERHTLSVDCGEGGAALNYYDLDAGTTLECIYFSECPVTLTASAPEGKSFVRWETEGISLDDPASPSVTFNVTADGSIKAVYE